MACMVRPRAPNLSPEVEADLRRLDVEAVRDLLRISTDGYSGTSGQTLITLPSGRKTSRDILLDWIRWKTTIRQRSEAWRFWSTIVIATIAAVAAVAAAFEGWPAPKP